MRGVAGYTHTEAHYEYITFQEAVCIHTMKYLNKVALTLVIYAFIFHHPLVNKDSHFKLMFQRNSNQCMSIIAYSVFVTGCELLDHTSVRVYASH